MQYQENYDRYFKKMYLSAPGPVWIISLQRSTKGFQAEPWGQSAADRRVFQVFFYPSLVKIGRDVVLLAEAESK